WTLPSTRKKPPATKYLAVLRSCAPSSSSGYGRVRSGGACPGMNRKSAAITTPKNAAYVRNCSDERCLTYTGRASAQAGLEEVDDQRPDEVEGRDHAEDHPRADVRLTCVPLLVLADVAIADERPRRTLLRLLVRQNT